MPLCPIDFHLSSLQIHFEEYNDEISMNNNANEIMKTNKFLNKVISTLN